MEVWKEMGKEVSMEMAEGGKEGEEGEMSMLVRMEVGECGREGGEEEGGQGAG